MPLKRASRGRRKGGKGSSTRIQCTNCGATVPSDKAKKVTSRLNLVEHTLAKELRAQGAYIASPRILKWYCISCAIHFGILKIRSESRRRDRGRLR
jgi:small subunit ribosomal protein S26e